MYGYIVPDKQNLPTSDFVLYRAFYCGICCETGRLFGQMPRFTTNYDFAFLAALVHDFAESDIVIEEHGCVLNPKKKAILQNNPLLTRLVHANIMLCYVKAEDGVADGDGIKYKLVKKLLRGAYKKSAAACPDIAKRLDVFRAEQARIESAKTASVDRAADAFAGLMRDMPELLTGRTSEELKGLCYNIGKFVYLADALDDITEDGKKHRYNPFLCAYGDENLTRKAFIEAHKAELEFVFYGICTRAAECFERMRFTQSYGLIKNIVTCGMRGKTAELLGSTKKLPPPKI